jgi:hemerythrin superfamily protein
MADLAEVLIIDNLTIKRFGETFNVKGEAGDFINFHNFLKNCHMQMEEKVLYPNLRKGNWTDERWLFRKMEQFEGDHKMIDSLGQDIIKWYGEGDMEMLRDHLPLYFKILKDHGNSEESYVFSRWKLLPEAERTDTMKDAMRIVNNFGRKRYAGLTDLSDSAISYIFGDSLTALKHLTKT